MFTKLSLTVSMMAATAALLLLSTQITKAGEFGTAQEARAMLDRAVAAIKQDKTKALAMFNGGRGGFKDRDLYVICANASDGIITASPTKKGASLKNFPSGEKVMKTAMEGTVHEIIYWWPRPDTVKPLRKHTFYTKMGDQICGVGYWE
jgi:hypothetical protein